MTKIKEAIATITERLTNVDVRVKHLEDILDWVIKLVIGTLIIAALGILIKTKV